MASTETRNCPHLGAGGCTLESCTCAEIEASDYVGIVGVLCGAETVDRIIRKTRAGPFWPATCNRWADHPGNHKMTDLKNFSVALVWTDARCRKRTYKEIARLERARSEQAVRLEVVDSDGQGHFV